MRSAVPLDDCVEAVLAGVATAEAQMDRIVAAAEAVAKRWVGGAELCVAGDTSFSDEAFYRAGGLIAIRRIGPEKANHVAKTLSWSDVPDDAILFYGLHHSVDAEVQVFRDLRSLSRSGRMVVLFGSSNWPICRKLLGHCRQRLPEGAVWFVDTQLPVDTRLTTRDGTRYGDYAPAVSALHLWTFTAELIAACTREGKTPGVWPSMLVDDWQAFEAQYRNVVFHDDVIVGPIGAGKLGGQYLEVLGKQMRAALASQPQTREGGKRLAATSADRVVYTMVESHLLSGEAHLPRELKNWSLVQRGFRWPQAARTVVRGDTVLWLGYFNWPDRRIEDVLRRGASFVGATVSGPQAEPPRDVWWVPASWAYPDAVVELPGYPLKACPTSGIVQTVLLWGLVGETLNAVQDDTVEEAHRQSGELRPASP
ncbi:MAG TPA: hypothetical protein VMZ31_14855 [Phycisphaerae bacterium]|nr:hypothetical protein [Phycisphaerae bacterium]